MKMLFMINKVKNVFLVMIAVGMIGMMLYVFISPVVSGIIYTVNKSYISMAGVETSATLTDYEVFSYKGKGGNTEYNYIPEVSFYTTNNTVVTATSKLNEGGTENISIGSPVTIKYEKSNPSKFIITNAAVMGNSNMMDLGAGIDEFRCWYIHRYIHNIRINNACK